MSFIWSTAKKEYIAIGALLIIYLAFLIPALVHERTLVRDDLRKADLGTIKFGLEMYYNKHTYFPPTPDGKIGCTNYGGYRYCVTSLENKHASGFYLQAQLESRQPEARGFDEDEHRKYDFRVLREGTATLYRVCGGVELQCRQ